MIRVTMRLIELQQGSIRIFLRLIEEKKRLGGVDKDFDLDSKRLNVIILRSIGENRRLIAAIEPQNAAIRRRIV